MNFLNRYIANLFISSYEDKTIVPVLKKSIQLLDNETLIEIRERTKSFVSNDGGFCDRAGKSDLYYSLFGLFVSEALDDDENLEKLRKYTHNPDFSFSDKGVYLYCAAILYSRFPGNNKNAKLFKKQIKDSLLENSFKPDYSLFLGVLTLFYQKEYLKI